MDHEALNGLERTRTTILHEILAGAPLEEILTLLVTSAETQIPGLRCSVLLLSADGQRLHCAAAPSLPTEYNEAIDGIEIGPNVGSCGAAAYHKKRVIVADIATHPNWSTIRPLTEAANIGACWSEPFFSTEGQVLGTFAMYRSEPSVPGDFELDFISSAAQLAGLSVSLKRANENLRDSEEQFRQLAENIREVFWLTDWIRNRVLYVSPAYENIWGHTCQSLYDDPKSWSNNIHLEDHDRVVDLFRRSGEGAYETEYRIVRSDGEIRWIYDRAFPILDESGRVYRIAGFSEDVTERKRVEEQLRRAHQELAESSAQKLKSLETDLALAEEQERRRIAVDLHDGLNQTLTLAMLKLSALKGSCEADQHDKLQEVHDLIQHASQSTRSLTFQLSPPILHDLGFLPALEWLTEHMQESYELAIELTVEEMDPPPLDERISVLLFRAVRELLINVAKHAEADTVKVAVQLESHRLRIDVADDGVAFDPKSVECRGLGIHSIRDRLSNLGGHMSIHSEAGEGTVISMVAPLEVE